MDRQALVTRHNVVLRQFDVENPLTVGNGEFAFTADGTGLQTFAESFTNTIPLGTLSHWGWHTAPNPEGWAIDRFQFREFPDLHGRRVGYADVPGNRQTPEVRWLRANPHRLHLGQIGFLLTRADGKAAEPNDLKDIEQTLDLWNGVLFSRFSLQGRRVEVQTVCHPKLDLVAVRVASALLKEGRISIQIHFPYGTGATATADWTRPEAHETTCTQPAPGVAYFARRLDGDTYHAAAAWTPAATLTEEARHRFVLASGKEAEALEFVCGFSRAALDAGLPTFDQARGAACTHWNRFWQTGGAIDLSGSKDPRWRELERRIVLSQYLTAIQCAGSLPPQESGLTYNTWEGKFHLEMHWWHAAQFALWDRLPLLEKSLGYYQAILPRAQATAKRQGYTGARWPKMTSPSGAESPSSVGPFLIWQQPHPIFYAELVYRQRKDRATLERFRDVVLETAEFMASYATWDDATNRYVLGPILQCAQEIFPKDKTLNPTYEITYWVWGLQKAQEWRQRLGLPRVEKWDRVLKDLAKPPTEEGKYLFAETATGTYTQRRWVDDHPSVTAAFGLLPGPGINRQVMRQTLFWILDNWNWPDTWGWDYPMVAMCAARLGEPERAVDALLLDTPKNKYRLNGHNHQRPGLTIYLPGNGGLLYAAALMTAGWEGAPARHAPGFPDNGQWTVRWEGLHTAP
ncbi:MAG: glycoside hydrolase family 65 [Phycisphaerae bacterium]|nr:glycoside hydrolase family 65 [Phycisphaerae bacterium]